MQWYNPLILDSNSLIAIIITTKRLLLHREIEKGGRIELGKLTLMGSSAVQLIITNPHENMVYTEGSNVLIRDFAYWTPWHHNGNRLNCVRG